MPLLCRCGCWIPNWHPRHGTASQPAAPPPLTTPSAATAPTLPTHQIAWETKAEDIQVLHVAPVVYWTRFMLIATVYSRPQLNAILGKIVKEAADVHGRRLALSPTGT